MVKNAKASGNQAMVRKIRAPGFIFVLSGAISAFRNGAIREKTTPPLVIPKPGLTARDLLAGGSETADSSRNRPRFGMTIP
jgi:hypothetical protein